MAESLIDRFFDFYLWDIHRRLESKFIPEPNSGCWLWYGATDDKGYGRLKFCNANVLAHRLSYELIVGPIPDGMVLDHLCRNPACVNPEHLEPVTLAENTRRGRAAEVNRAIRLGMTHCKRGHLLAGANLYVSPTNGQRVCIACKIIQKRIFRAKQPHKRPDLKGLALGGAANGARQKAKTHCPHGHPYSGDNLMIAKGTGYRGCKACHAFNARKSAARRRSNK